MIRKPETVNTKGFSQDELCYMCKNIFSCKQAFKVEECPHLPYERSWGRCKSCIRIVSPFHSNCPKCGCREIVPVCSELVDEKRKVMEK